MAELNTGVQYISGVGPKRVKAFNKLGVFTLRDLVSYFPRAYEDRTKEKRISDLILGETVCVRAVVAQEPTLSHIRKGLDLVKTRAVDESGSLKLTFFNQAYLKNALVPGESYVFYGRISGTLIAPEMTNPVFEKEGSESVTGRIMPVYPLTAGLSQNMLAKSIYQGLKACGDVLPDELPEYIRIKYELAQARFAYENIHFPGGEEELTIARRRLIFEELFVLSCAMASIRAGMDEKAGDRLPDTDAAGFFSLLPFEPTSAQRRAVSEAFSDMSSGKPMSRLVQGDVGSGKTVVAAACCWYAARFGRQAAFMAPTEILARQHYKTLTELLEPAGVRICLLVGGMTQKARRETLEKLANGEYDLAVGTHALISEDVSFKKLSLVIADEQHRFGVRQRAALSDKGNTPHILVMSATPIPRTLALIIYGDLDVSVIDELPPGRTPVETYAVGESMRPRINAFIRKLVGEGRQVYIVCPAIETADGADDGLKAAVEYAEKLKNEVFPDLAVAVALVHGKMKAKEKEAVMASFSAGETSVLVSTTVIEVGVDVPNAALMVVENADRFGLSQLHQLRGRVGRGQHRSYCVLFEGAGGETSMERLKIMCSTTDGFKIAEEDLKLRGPGDFFGRRQHGLPQMRIADLASDMKYLKLAQQAAGEVIKDDPELKKPENARLGEAVRRMIEENASTLN